MASLSVTCKYSKSGHHVRTIYMGHELKYGGRNVCKHCGATYTTKKGQ